MKKRLSICYCAPGHSLVPTSGTTRNMLSLARALSEWAEVTVAFRSLPRADTELRPAIRVLGIENRSEPRAKRFPAQQADALRRAPGGIQLQRAGPEAGVDDEATRGVNPLAHLAYTSSVRRFARKHAGSFDVVFEKGWRLSGFALHCFASHGVPGAVVENDARCWSDSRRDLRTTVKWLLHSTAQAVAGHYSRKAPLVIAETEELKDQLFLVRKIPLEKIAVVPLGVDHGLFHPMDQLATRTALSVSRDKTLMLYVGGMDKYHDLTPLLESLQTSALAGFELHIVGEGEYREAYQGKAQKAKVPVIFHGRVPHEEVPRYIAASDLCIAPYRADAFFNRTVTFSTLKIPEYMACGRPVASIASGEIKRLIKPGVSGFLFPNSPTGWSRFLETLPSRTELQKMGIAAEKTVRGRSWEQTARGYLEACAQHIPLPGREFPRDVDSSEMVRAED